jgi:nicotinamide mononucleotide transporter
MFFDIFGSLCSLLSTYFFIRINNKAWLVGIIATCVNGWLYWHKGIYADMGLEIFYLLTMAYGWHQWRRGKENAQTNIIFLNAMQLGLLLLATMVLFLLIYYCLINFTHSTVATLDALTTALSITAQWLMCYKVLITWLFWFITDTLYAVMYLNKGLPFHSVLMLVYTGLAIVGYISWNNRVKKQGAVLMLNPVVKS